MTKSQRSFMFGNWDAVLNELQPKSGFLCPIHESSQCSSEEKTCDFNQFGPREKAPLQFWEDFSKLSCTFGYQTLCLKPHNPRSWSRKGKSSAGQEHKVSSFVCQWVWSDELGELLAEAVSPPSLLQPSKAQTSTLERGVYKMDKEENFPLSPNWCESQTKLSPCT